MFFGTCFSQCKTMYLKYNEDFKCKETSTYEHLQVIKFHFKKPIERFTYFMHSLADVRDPLACTVIN